MCLYSCRLFHLEYNATYDRQTDTGNAISLFRLYHLEYNATYDRQTNRQTGNAISLFRFRRVTQVVVLVKLFGSSTVHMILISEMLAEVVQKQTDVDLTKCHVILIVGACLIPLTWLGSPKDLW